MSYEIVLVIIIVGVLYILIQEFYGTRPITNLAALMSGTTVANTAQNGTKTVQTA